MHQPHELLADRHHLRWIHTILVEALLQCVDLRSLLREVRHHVLLQRSIWDPRTRLHVGVEELIGILDDLGHPLIDSNMGWNSEKGKSAIPEDGEPANPNQNCGGVTRELTRDIRVVGGVGYVRNPYAM